MTVESDSAVSCIVVHPPSANTAPSHGEGNKQAEVSMDSDMKTLGAEQFRKETPLVCTPHSVQDICSKPLLQCLLQLMYSS